MHTVLQNRQDMKLMMTQQLRQSIELLQLSMYDLEQFIREQTIDNPLIELKENTEAFNKNKMKIQKKYDTNYSFLENIEEKDNDYRNELFDLVRLTYKDPQTKNILKIIIYNLDDNGYFPHFLDFMNEKEYLFGLSKLQEIAPKGIGARSLKECLLLQVDPNNKVIHEIIDKRLENLANKKWKIIAREMKITLKQVQEAFNFIKTLNPRPGADLLQIQSDYTIPDIIVEESHGEILFVLNDKYLPKIDLNTYYLSLMNQSKEMSNYFSDLYTNYKWLINSLERRKETIIKIMHVIISRQRSFFYNGIDYVQPLTMKEIAEEIGVHESTVSRATANKLIQTSMGTFDIRILFNSKLEQENGEYVSKLNVIKILKEIINNENKLKPLSDHEISELIEKEWGIIVSRRTIAKYREEQNILSSVKRKEFIL